ncbi:T9SS type B sorting domain-containing protein [Christiangramia crocea]|uniref:T9SS type B sorting domain-containing protein n=1 Tax=Christiangramia crocea TaxID=2904124 RepID=A0A9X1UYU0_9FLAO|nr:T9SS type B sorting domain-containing protein [Gramella crocea]MCG9972815.1 T9SS type B sorting domain-containing protein [Gramella crocea]
MSTFAQAPKLAASGDQLYCPLSTIPIVTSFSIQNPSSSPINAVFIQISEGYDAQHDRLYLTGNHQNISSNWNQTTAKLQLNISPGTTLEQITEAVSNIYFESTNNSFRGERVFSITTGQANYLASTGHYYEYVSDLGISWEDAKIAAAQRTYNGLQGYLATLVSAEEAQLSGEQADGAGWIGGTDKNAEGVWKWVTGPEGLNGGLVFWYGGSSGYSPNYANWNINQPDNAHGGPGEDYLHITDPSVGNRGAWNDLRVDGDPPGVYHPKGYIVEYGGMPGDPEIDISASTRIYAAEITETSATYICGPNMVSISAEANAGTVYWFTAASGGTPIHEGTNYNPTVNSTTDFYVSAGPKGCNESQREKITVTYFEPITVINNNVKLTICTVDGSQETSSTFDLEEAIPMISSDSSYYFEFYTSQADAESETNMLDETLLNISTSSEVFVKVSNQSPCFEIVRLSLEVSSSNLPQNFIHTLSTCDNDENQDGLHNFDLSEARGTILNALPADQNYSISFYSNSENALNEINEITNEANFINETPGRQELFVRIENESTNGCYAIGPYVELVVREMPEFDLPEFGQFCSMQPSYDIIPIDTDETYNYAWYDEEGNLISNNRELTVTSPGWYSVFATSSEGCTSETKMIEIIDSGPAALTWENVRVTATGDTYEISIIDPELLGIGDYEFILNTPTGQYQNDGNFYNVLPGTHTLYINDKNGCGISSLELFLFGIPEFFTPNGDGYNDRWNIKGIPNQENFLLSIYDRYGKLLIRLDQQSNGWNGRYLGKLMPADDYWFHLNLKDGTSYKGHFSLIRSTR